MTTAAYASLPPLGHLSVALLLAELVRLQDRAASRVDLFGGEVRFAGATRGARNEQREKVAV